VRLAGQVARIDKYCVTKNYSNKDIAKQILESMLPVCKGYTFSIYIPKKKLGLLKQFKSLGFKVIDEIPQLFGKGHHGLNLQKHMKITKKVKPRAKKLVPVIEPEPEKIHLPEEAENRDMDSVYDPRNYINF